MGRRVGRGRVWENIVFWTESMLESDYFPEKRGNIWQECRCKWNVLVDD